MFGYYNNGCFRRYIILMGELFNDIRYERTRENGSKHIKVPISYGSKEKFISSLNKLNTPLSEGSVAKVETILPRMRLNLIDISYASEFKTSMLNRNIAYKKNTTDTVSLYNPVPYKLTFELGVYTRHEGDMFNIIEQILPYFQPHFCCNMREIINEHVIKRDVNVNLASVMIDEDADGDTFTRRRLEWTLTFDLVAWIYPPSDALEGEIKTIYLNFVANEVELGDGDNLEKITLEVNPPEATKETWEGKIKETWE